MLIRRGFFGAVLGAAVLFAGAVLTQAGAEGGPARALLDAAANGDIANKIGTYKIAVVAHENGIPFYAVMPTSTIDMTLPHGDAIPIEERDPREVTHIEGVPIAPEGVHVGNPAFDVTPHKYITALVTEKDVVYPPFDANLLRIMGGD